MSALVILAVSEWKIVIGTSTMDTQKEKLTRPAQPNPTAQVMRKELRRKQGWSQQTAEPAPPVDAGITGG
jgi:hypothetical protein